MNRPSGHARPGRVARSDTALAVPRAWSDLTPSWMTAALSARLPGVDVATVKVGPVHDGTNRRARVEVGYRHGQGPPSVFVKGSGQLVHRLALTVLGATATEARLAASAVTLPLEHPRPYAGAVDRRRMAAVVVSDDLVAAGGRPNHPTTPLGVAEVASGLDGLARLHAAFWDRPLPAGLRFLRPWRLGRSWAVVSVASLARGLRRLRQLQPPAVRPVGAVGLGRQFHQSAQLAASGPQTVLHGDPHPGNTYLSVDGTTGFLDWQLARTGHWSHDVGYFLAGSLTVAERRVHERQLLAGYLDALGRAGAPAPTWEDAWRRYRATPAFGLATWLHTLAFGTLQPVDACLATIARFAAAYDDLDTARTIGP